jgi:two-component system response regulator BaeR
MEKILIVEDEPKIAELLQKYLANANYVTHWLTSGVMVVPWLDNNSVDLVLLDIMLPDQNGIEVCKAVRQFSTVPIIMVTAKVEEIDRLLGLELGADDYICKPFSPREVLARIKAVLRRSQIQPLTVLPVVSEVNKLILDESRLVARFNVEEIDLTMVEFKLLSIMYQQAGRIFSRDQLMSHIYSDHRIVSERTIDSHIKKLRKKIDTLVPDRELIHSVYAAGYRFEH